MENCVALVGDFGALVGMFGVFIFTVLLLVGICLTAAVAASTAHRVLLQSSEKNALVAVDVSQDGLCATKIVFGDAVTV